jgi:hypothetical protein
MNNSETEGKTASEVVIIGNVEAAVKLWGKVNTYKSRERSKGRKLRLRDALCELAERGAEAEGISE